MSTLDRLDEIDARAAAATEGPWFREYGDTILSSPDPRDVADGYEEPRAARVVRRAAHRNLSDAQAISDATFIAAARQDVPWLVDLTRRQDAALRAVLGVVGPPPVLGAYAQGYDQARADVHAAITAALDPSA